MGDYEKARARFDRAVALDPGYGEAYLSRALALQNLREYDGALKDIDRGVERGAPKARAAFLRVRVLELAGRKDEAKRELAGAMKLEPNDEIGWLSRASARDATDLPGALQDIDAALAINPRSLTGLVNRANVLARLGRAADAIRALDNLLEVYPDYTKAWSDRGVMNARLGKWDAAKADAKETLKRDESPRNLFQVGAIHALLTQHDPAYKTEAIRLLTAALKGGFGYDHIERDPDLAPIRDTAEFRRLVESVRLISAPK
jgi:tetratricopeptide (TPR) repeat protein